MNFFLLFETIYDRFGTVFMPTVLSDILRIVALILIFYFGPANG